MEKKENGLISYLVVIFTILIFAVVLIFCLGRIAEIITEKTDSYYLGYFKNEEPGFSSPWYEKGLHRVDEAFVYGLNKSDKNTVYAIGSSFTSNNINDETVDLNDYDIAFMVCGNGNYKSNKILFNLLESESLIKPDDIVKYEVSYSTFRDVSNTITESVLNKWGKYSVDDELHVTKNSSIFAPVYNINIELIKIQNLWELLVSFWEQNNHPSRYPDPKGYANYKNNYFNYDAVADSCYICEVFEEQVISDISEINGKCNTIIELSPIPQGLIETEFGTEVNRYIDEDLIPYLEKNNIKYIDLRFDYDDSDFADGVHLSYKSTIEYTKKLNDYLNFVIDTY